MKRIIKHAIAAVAIAGFGASAFAQYIWMDENGVKQYSDMPPPASVPKSRIIKAPNYKAPPSSDSASSSSAAASSSAPSLADKNADYNKRKAEREKKEKEAEEKAKNAANKEKNCERARNYERALSSGQRLARTGANGEREFLSDNDRAREMQEVRESLANCN